MPSRATREGTVRAVGPGIGSTGSRYLHRLRVGPRISIGRLAVVALCAVGLATGCTGDDAETLNTGHVEFLTRGGDSFEWSEDVVGESDCEVTTIEVNGRAVEVPVITEGRLFSATVPLRAGDNEVVARCFEDSGVSKPIGFRARLRDGPTARIGVRVEGDSISLDATESEPAESDGAAITGYVWTPMGSANVSTEPSLELEAPTADGEYFVGLEVTDEKGRSDAAESYFVVEGGAARSVELATEHPSWIDTAVMYAPIPALWGNAGPTTLRERLPYLKNLGIDVLWLWPPTSQRAPGEEYAITDYFAVDHSWGPEAALKEMVTEAHRHGMRVIVDFVPNHLSSRSRYFRDAEEHGEYSAYWDFFDRRGGVPTHYFDWNHLPNLNVDNPEVRNMLVEAGAYWVREIGIDGFRMDVAWGVKRRSPDFWPVFRDEMQRIAPDILLLAEGSAVDPYWFDNGFDVAYDWTSSLGRPAWGEAFRDPEHAVALLKRALTNRGRGYSPGAKILRFLNNNDTGTRFIDRYGPATTRVAATLQFTVPGLPAMFAGDEIGASYEPYSNLTPIYWRDRHGLRPHYRRLIELRHGFPSLTSGRIQLLETDSSSALAFVRPSSRKGKAVVVILNFGPATRVELLNSSALETAVGSGAMRDLLGGEEVSLEMGAGVTSVSVGEVTSMVLVER